MARRTAPFPRTDICPEKRLAAAASWTERGRQELSPEGIGRVAAGGGRHGRTGSSVAQRRSGAFFAQPWLAGAQGRHQGRIERGAQSQFLLHLAGRSADRPDLLQRAGLNGLQQRLASQLSFGQRRRLALAGLIGADAPLWLLDEPDANLDKQGRSWLSQELESHLSGGGCAVLAGHRMDWSIQAPVMQLILGAEQ